jgi:phytoene dehydrogenase-like protein
MNMREKWRLASLLITLDRLDPASFDSVTLLDWLERTAGAGNHAHLLGALFRLSTYCDDPDRMSAGVAIRQLKLALAGNVWYLDGGWQTLVDGLRDRAIAHGAKLRTGASVRAVKSEGDEVCVLLAGGEELRGRSVVLAVDPKSACELLELPADSPLARWTASAVPVRAACLDLALARLTRPAQRFALGLDRPYYASVHSAAAKLAPAGVAVMHVMKYLGHDTATSTSAVEQELEGFLDLLQPGWQERTLARRFLPSMTVAHGLPQADSGGLAGRPAGFLRERPNVFLAGDWVGPEGWLADASAASAAAAARRVLAAGSYAGPMRSMLHVAS